MSKKQKNAEYEDLKEELNEHFKKWEKAIPYLKNEFTIDGALPGYPHQKKLKILYIGQESHGSGGNILMENICIGTRYPSLQTSTFRRVVLFTYGLLNDKTWEEVENWQTDGGVGKWKDDIETPEKPNKELSFAFMNVSKYANNKDENGSAPSGGFKNYVDENLGDLGENKSGRNFIREEINILNPDLIISWNLRAKLGVKRFKKILTGDLKRKCSPIKSCGFLTDRACIYEGKGNREIPLLDTWHFSARNKYNGEDFYTPLRKAVNSKAVKDLIAKKKAQDKAELR